MTIMPPLTFDATKPIATPATAPEQPVAVRPWAERELDPAWGVVLPIQPDVPADIVQPAPAPVQAAPPGQPATAKPVVKTRHIDGIWHPPIRVMGVSAEMHAKMIEITAVGVFPPAPLDTTKYPLENLKVDESYWWRTEGVAEYNLLHENVRSRRDRVQKATGRCFCTVRHFISENEIWLEIARLRTPNDDGGGGAYYPQPNSYDDF